MNLTCEVCESVGKCVIGGTDEFHGFIKLRKCPIFVMDSYWKDSAFTAGKRGAKFQARYVKGVPFLCKNCICTGLEVGAESPCMEICCVIHKIRAVRQTNEYLSWALFLNLQEAGAKFEKLLGWTVLKNPNFNPLQSCSVLPICGICCFCYVILTFLLSSYFYVSVNVMGIL